MNAIAGRYHKHLTKAVVRMVIASRDEQEWFVGPYITGDIYLVSIHGSP